MKETIHNLGITQNKLPKDPACGHICDVFSKCSSYEKGLPESLSAQSRGTLRAFCGEAKASVLNISLQCEAPNIAKFVYNSNNYGLWYL